MGKKNPLSTVKKKDIILGFPSSNLLIAYFWELGGYSRSMTT